MLGSVKMMNDKVNGLPHLYISLIDTNSIKQNKATG